VKILVGVDGSPGSVAALAAANRLLLSPDRQLDILHVTPPVRLKGFSSKRHTAFHNHSVREMAQCACKAGVDPAAPSVHFLSKVGSPSAELITLGRGYDLVAVASKGRRKAGETGLGPVSSRVVEHSLAPVLLTRGLRNDQGLRILIATDGSRASIQSIEILANLFDLSAAEICLMHVEETA